MWNNLHMGQIRFIYIWLSCTVYTSESHVMKLIASHIHSISPKSDFTCNFLAAKMVNTKCSEKKGLSPQLICFSLFGIRHSYGLWIARFDVHVWVHVRVTRPLAIHITVSNLHLLYYFLKIYLHIALESNAIHISDAFRSEMCHVICM